MRNWSGKSCSAGVCHALAKRCITVAFQRTELSAFRFSDVKTLYTSPRLGVDGHYTDGSAQSCTHENLGVHLTCWKVVNALLFAPHAKVEESLDRSTRILD